MRYLIAAAPALALVALIFSGCAKPSNESNASAPAAGQEQEDHADEHKHADHAEHAGMEMENGQTDMEKMNAELAKLSPEDAAAAKAQHFCPVSGEMLGTMGPPQKVDVNGTSVWICCEHCKDKLLANADEYLAKIKKE
ncbi:MAG: hypothetical protein KDA42_17685 [Planctomycetales bacterium]|nr:hypothetical protein [Planctomycetales bacterium]